MGTNMGTSMLGTSHFVSGCENLYPLITPGLHALLEASNLAEDTDSDLWDFAVGIRRLHKLGLEDSHLRWLVRKGYVLHARETTREKDDQRRFRCAGNLSFCKRTCFTITDVGLETARSLIDWGAETADLTEGCAGEINGRANRLPQPEWNGVTRELRLDGMIVKRFRWQAVNQEIVLSAFEEDQWPPVIDDPLPPKPEQDTKRRLHDTIKALNRNQEHQMLRFHGNGTGEGIRWEFLV